MRGAFSTANHARAGALQLTTERKRKGRWANHSTWRCWEKREKERERRGDHPPRGFRISGGPDTQLHSVTLCAASSFKLDPSQLSPHPNTPFPSSLLFHPTHLSNSLKQLTGRMEEKCDGVGVVNNRPSSVSLSLFLCLLFIVQWVRMQSDLEHFSRGQTLQRLNATSVKAHSPKGEKCHSVVNCNNNLCFWMFLTLSFSVAFFLYFTCLGLHNHTVWTALQDRDVIFYVVHFSEDLLWGGGQISAYASHTLINSHTLGEEIFYSFSRNWKYEVNIP